MNEPLKTSDHFQSYGGFSFLISFVRIVLNVRFPVAGKVSMTGLYADFWDILPGCAPTVFGKLLGLGCWSCLSFFQEILELVHVLCLPIE